MINFIIKLEDLCCFGYVFFIWVKEGGVLKWVGYIEVVVDLVRLVGLYLVGVICEI